jgi:hypothetical protein
VNKEIENEDYDQYVFENEELIKEKRTMVRTPRLLPFGEAGRGFLSYNGINAVLMRKI